MATAPARSWKKWLKRTCWVLGLLVVALFCYLLIPARTDPLEEKLRGIAATSERMLVVHENFGGPYVAPSQTVLYSFTVDPARVRALLAAEVGPQYEEGEFPLSSGKLAVFGAPGDPPYSCYVDVEDEPGLWAPFFVRVKFWFRRIVRWM